MQGFADLRDALLDRTRSVLARHGRKLWWLHSVYALTLGAGVVLFAQKGFARARWLAVSVLVAWLLVVAAFRVFGRKEVIKARPGDPPPPSFESPRARLRFYVVTYVLKNLYQGMLFFLLPFYWKSTTFWAPNAIFVLLLGICAVVSTLDVVFDEIVMRHRVIASLFHGFTLFASLNLLVPALLPETRTLMSLVAAAAVSVLAFWTLHVPVTAFVRNRNLVLLAVTLLGGMGLASVARPIVPPVPMYLGSGAVGPTLLPDGRLLMEVKTLHTSAIRQLYAVTDVVVPGGEGDELHHVWRHDGAQIARIASPARAPGPRGTLRLRSTLEAQKLPADLTGAWSIDVETRDGQLVGRVAFRVID